MSTIKVGEISDVMRKNYLTYAEYVIKDRAIPDARDGLKPVHRRILWAMFSEGWTKKSSPKKSARVVGSVIGKYHPHGELSVYNALVRLAQPFSLNYPLVDGSGNFGSVDGSPAAAQRYTECRLSDFAEKVFFDDISENTVDFVDNYDGSEKEPVYLPARIPMLLLVGISGIAVGTATEIPPYSLDEICKATIAYIKNPAITDDALFELIQGPELPLGGVLSPCNGPKSELGGGSGSYWYRPSIAFENDASGNKNIILKSVPYAANKSDIIVDIAQAVQDEKVEGITDIRDESAKNEIRIVLEVSKRSDVNSVLFSLYKNTKIQTKLNCNVVSIINSQAKVSGIREILSCFVDARTKAVTRRTAFRKAKAVDKLEITDAILVAIKHHEEVIRIVRNESDPKQKLIDRFSLSERQADAIYNMPIRRFSKMDKAEYTNESVRLSDYIKEQDAILASSDRVKNIIMQEIEEIRTTFKTDRKTTIIDNIEKVTIKDTIKKQEVVVMFLPDGTMKSTPVDDYRIQKRRGRGSKATASNETAPTYITTVSTHDDIMIFTDAGNRYRLSAHQIPTLEKGKKPRPISDYIEGYEPSEKVIGVTDARLGENESIFSITKNGMARRIEGRVVNSMRDNNTSFYPVQKDDRLVFSRVIKDADKSVLIFTREGLGLHCSLDDFRVSASKAGIGVRAIKLKKGDSVISASLVANEDEVLVITTQGYGKKVSVGEFMLKGRGGQGISVGNLEKDDGVCIGASVFSGDDDTTLFAITNLNIAIRISLEDIRVMGRSARGVQIKRMGIGEKIICSTLE